MDEWKRGNWLKSETRRKFEEDRETGERNRMGRINLNAKELPLSYKPFHESKSLNTFANDSGRQYGIIIIPENDRTIS